MAEFCAKYHPGVSAEVKAGKSPQEALRSTRRRKSVKAAADDTEERRLRMGQVLDEFEPLPRRGEIRDAQKATRDFVRAFDPWEDDALADPRPARAGVVQVNTYLEDAQPVVELNKKGFLELGHQVRSESKAKKNGWRVRAVLELIEANALNPTVAQIATLRSKKGARKMAEEIWDRHRGHVERRIARDARLGKTSQVLADQYGLPPSTVADIVKRSQATP